MSHASVTVGIRELRAAVNTASAVTEWRNSLPILDCVRVTADADRIAVRGTDLDITIEAGADVEAANAAAARGDFDVAVYARPLRALLGAMPGRSVRLEQADGRLIVSGEAGGGLTAKLATPPVTDFPDPATIEAAPVVLDGAALREALRRCLPAVSDEDARYYLNGIYVEPRSAGEVAGEGQAPRAMDAEKPLGTVVAGGVKHFAVAAFMQKFAENGKGYDPADPLHTVMAGAPRHAVVTAHIEQANGGPNNENLAGRAADDPLSTVAAKGSQQRLVTSNLIKLRGTSDGHLEGSGVSVDEPLNTVSAGGIHAAEVRAFLLKYYGNEQDGHGLEGPLGTVTAKDRFGLVTVTIDGEDYVIVDIGMRMLSPRELFNAQGFPSDYIIDRDAHGRPITKTAQVAKCGNSVCPPLAEALVRAQFPEAAAARWVA